MRRMSVGLFFCLFAGLSSAHWQAESPGVRKPEELVDQWFIRLNALDDWWISMDGKEENRDVVEHFAALYAPEAAHQVGPSERQIGTVVFYGHDGVRKWADDFAKSHVQLGYRVDFMTQSEKTVQPAYIFQPPWGGTGTSVEFTAVYALRQSRKRFIVPGAAFFLFNEAGKIVRVRLYMLRDEAAEILP